MATRTKPLVVTVDAGSGSCRALVFDAVGNCLGLGQQEWAYRAVPDWPGGYDFDTTDGWQRVTSCIRSALGDARAHPDEIGAVSATSMREGFVLYDDTGTEIWGCPNIDARATREAEELIEEGLAERQYRRGGDWTSITAPARLRWIQRQQPEVWRRARFLTMLGDWVIQCLSGVFCTDPTLGSSSGLFALADRTWSRETANELGIPDIFPPVVESGTVVGHVTARAAEMTGLRAGTPVVVGGGDTQLALLGAGITSPVRFGTVGGTFWQSAAVVDSALIDPAIRLRTLCHVLPGTWMIEGVGFLHGFSTRWIRDGLFGAACPQSPDTTGYDRLEMLASAIPAGSHGVFYLCSRPMNARRWQHGPPSIIGFDVGRPTETGLGALFRAVEEEAAYVSRAHYEILEEVCRCAPEEISFVGGASQGQLWPQILADVTGLKVRVPPVAEATCFGAALCALIGAGVYRDLNEAVTATARPNRLVEPNHRDHAAYDDVYPRWLALSTHMLDAANQGWSPYLWRGAGA